MKSWMEPKWQHFEEISDSQRKGNAGNSGKPFMSTPDGVSIFSLSLTAPRPRLGGGTDPVGWCNCGKCQSTQDLWIPEEGVFDQNNLMDWRQNRLYHSNISAPRFVEKDCFKLINVRNDWRKSIKFYFYNAHQSSQLINWLRSQAATKQCLRNSFNSNFQDIFWLKQKNLNSFWKQFIYLKIY